jgi:hypothetical protein
MWRSVAVLALVMTSACGPATDRPVSLASTLTAATPAAAASTGLRHTVSSHCGVLSTTVDDVLWLADPPLGDHNPPAGWDENDTPGVFAVQGADVAVFTADTGVTARFVRAPAGTSDPGGCE